MVLPLAFAFIAGVLTILAPCTLPVVPLILGAAAADGRRRVAGLLLGFGLAFVGTTILLASALAAAGLTTSTLRVAAAVVLGAAGLSLALPRLGARLDRRFGPLARSGVHLADRSPNSGFAGGLVLGGAIGLIWAPCVGPIMAAVIAVAVSRGPSVETLAVAVAYVAGAAIPLGLIAAWGRRATRSLGAVARGGRLQRSFGVAMVLSALLVVSGLDLPVQNGLSAWLPGGWTGALTSVEQQPAVQDGLAPLEESGVTNDVGAHPGPPGLVELGGTGAPLPAPIATSLPSSVVLEHLGAAPDFQGITAWINSPALTIAGLRGKVVLVEFWTFDCINCQHVQPYVKAWSERYGPAGLVVVGVHTPELSFERDLGNVRQAVSQAGLTYPVAFDPAFATWNAYANSYWPAFYFIDKAGQVRHTHFGEGDYAGSEQVIRQLLGASD
ncbi:MAG TPA: cytochrome c biogenesis protein CcdA [Candidatus Limnocylindrales bacterium]